MGKVADNIINRNFQAERPLQKWTTDVTQFNLPWGKCYLSPILDMKTNEVISYNLSLSPNMEQVKDIPAPDKEHTCVGWNAFVINRRGELQGLIEFFV